MITLKHASSHASAALVLALYVACAGPAQAAARKPAPAADPLSDFRQLAQQRPWDCPPPSPMPELRGAWAAGSASCAWQNRLSQRSWTWSADNAPSCVSKQARWWAAAQAGLPPRAARSVWQAGWTVHSTSLSAGAVQRLLLVKRERSGQWVATEWRWDPNPRPATQRWQQERWQLLLDAAARAAPVQQAALSPNSARLQAVFGSVLGARAGEIGNGGMAMDAGAHCLQLSDPLPGESKLPLAYNATDSRLEQRAAIHLQLSRQLPGAEWLTPIKLLVQAAAPAGGAKFLATWLEGDELKSQLWMPAKSGGAIVRVRMSTRLAPGLGVRPDTAPVQQARQLVEHELEAIAAQWAVRYE